MAELKNDQGKNRLDLIPTELIEEVGKVLTFGANKYAPDAWRQATPEEYHRFVAAAMRHLEAYRRGEYFDDESGLPHLAHAATNLGFLLSIDKRDVWKDLNSLIAKLKEEEPFNRILAIARGGLVPATYIAHALGVKSIDTTKGNSVPNYVMHERVLIVDDISDSGDTLLNVVKLFVNPDCEVYTATIHTRTTTRFFPDFTGALVRDDSWIVYPWEDSKANKRRDNELGDN